MDPVENITAMVEVPASRGQPARSFVFARPMETWQADELESMRTAVERVEAAQRAGKFVVGFVGYEAAPAFDHAMRTPPRGSLPLCWFASFAEPIEFTRSERAKPLSGLRSQVPALSLRVTEKIYLAQVQRVLDHIAAGDIFQVNYTVRASVDNLDDPWNFFLERMLATPMPHSVYIDAADHAIVSLSPELFIRRRGDVLESRPMKGTAARRPSWLEDEAARLALAENQKERAENIMIVDLVRNDLGRVCEAGSVQVPELCVVTRYPTVHQMTSLVRGTLPKDTTLWEILRATFPPGSVTGAPKIRAMEIISELEPEPRGIYCGTIGLFLPGGDFECNVAIRTLEIRNPKPTTKRYIDSSSRVHPSSIGLGSGIVADSNPAAEWKETKLKGKFLTVPPPPEFTLIETLGWTPQDGFRNLERHLQRLRNSAEYFNWNLPPALADTLTLPPVLAAGQEGNLPQRVRLLLNREGKLQIDFAPLEPWPAAEVKLFVYWDEVVNPETVFLYHKTTVRGTYEQALAAAKRAGADDAVLLNTKGEITETTRANLLVKLRGEWLTPSLDSGLLPGIWREIQLEQGRCREGVVTIEDFLNAEEIVVGNSARGEGKGRIL